MGNYVPNPVETDKQDLDQWFTDGIPWQWIKKWGLTLLFVLVGLAALIVNNLRLVEGTWLWSRKQRAVLRQKNLSEDEKGNLGLFDD